MKIKTILGVLAISTLLTIYNPDVIISVLADVI